MILSAIALSIVATSMQPRGLGLGQTFIENRGQWAAEAKFLARHADANVWITDSGARLELPGKTNGRSATVNLTLSASPLNYQGAGDRKTRLNFLVGTDPNRHATGVRAFRELVSETTLGVRVRWQFSSGKPRFDFLVQPGASPAGAFIEIDGARSHRKATDNSLELNTVAGPVRLQEIRAFQWINGARRDVSCSLKQTAENAYGFDVGAYDPKYELVIDPTVYSTFFGGEADDKPADIAFDSTGAAVTVGSTKSVSFPTTTGALMESKAAETCAFVAKFDSSGSELVYCTYFGSSGMTTATGVALDQSGSPIFCGTTTGAVKTTRQAFQRYPEGGSEAYVAVLDAGGALLKGCTYFAGSGNEVGADVSFEANTGIVLVGNTTSSDLPLSTDFSPAYSANAGGQDGFVALLTKDCRSLRYSTYLGGSANDTLEAAKLWVISPDSYPEVVLAVGGSTSSSDFPTPHNPWFTARAGASDAIFALFTFSVPDYFFPSLEYSTGFGGGGADIVHGIDAHENMIFVSGGTSSSDWPVASEDFPLLEASFPVQSAPSDGFTVRFDRVYASPTGHYLAVPRFSTYVGADSLGPAGTVWTTFDSGRFLPGYDRSGCLTVTRSTQGYQQAANKYSSAVSLLTLSKTGKLVRQQNLYRVLGVSHTATVTGLYTDRLVPAGICGYTNRPSFPTTGNAFQSVIAGGQDGFVMLRTVAILDRISASIRSLTGGIQTSGAVHLTGPAPRGGAVVILSSSSVCARVPEFVIVPEGELQATFDINTTAVQSDTDVQLGADLGDGSIKRSVGIVVRQPRPTQIILPSYNIAGGVLVEARVLLDSPAPVAGITLSLESTNPQIVRVPAAIAIASGAVEGTFWITTVPVQDDEPATIRAVVAKTRVAKQCVVKPPRLGGLTVTLSSVIGGSSSEVRGVVQLESMAASGGETIDLTSDSSLAEIPASITVDAGKSSASFIIVHKEVNETTPVVIVAAARSRSARAQLILKPKP